jgi:hypothetical protein
VHPHGFVVTRSKPGIQRCTSNNCIYIIDLFAAYVPEAASFQHDHLRMKTHEHKGALRYFPEKKRNLPSQLLLSYNLKER